MPSLKYSCSGSSLRLSNGSTGPAHFWAANALLVGSLPGLVASLSAIATGTWMISRHLHLDLVGRSGRRQSTPILAH